MNRSAGVPFAAVQKIRVKHACVSVKWNEAGAPRVSGALQFGTRRYNHYQDNKASRKGPWNLAAGRRSSRSRTRPLWKIGCSGCALLLFSAGGRSACVGVCVYTGCVYIHLCETINPYADVHRLRLIFDYRHIGRYPCGAALVTSTSYCGWFSQH